LTRSTEIGSRIESHFVARLSTLAANSGTHHHCGIVAHLFASHCSAIANLGTQATGVSHKFRTVINHVDAHHAHFCTVPHHGHHRHIYVSTTLIFAVLESINASGLTFDADFLASFHFDEYRFSSHHRNSLLVFAVDDVAGLTINVKLYF
jgi:hypothetical protein